MQFGFCTLGAPCAPWLGEKTRHRPALAPMSQLLQSIGFVFYPLRDADDAANLIDAAARVPVATPRRATRMIDYMVNRCVTLTATAYEVASFLSRSREEGSGRFEAVASTIPPGEGQIIVTDRTTCIVCESPLEEPVYEHGKQPCASPTLFTQTRIRRRSLARPPLGSGHRGGGGWATLELEPLHQHITRNEVRVSKKNLARTC